jgi:hypothetical protein
MAFPVAIKDEVYSRAAGQCESQASQGFLHTCDNRDGCHNAVKVVPRMAGVDAQVHVDSMLCALLRSPVNPPPTRALSSRSPSLPAVAPA